MRDSTRDRRPEGEQPLPLPPGAEMTRADPGTPPEDIKKAIQDIGEASKGLTKNPEGSARLFHSFVYRFVKDAKDTTFPRMGPYTERKAAIVANRLTRVLRMGGRLEEGVSYRPEKVQYAGPGTLPENAR